MAYKDIADRNGNGVIRINYTYTQDAKNNRSTVTVTSIGFYSTNWYGTWFYAAGTVKIGSGSVSYSNAGTVDGCSVLATYTEYTLGNKSMPAAFTVNHNSSGNGSFTIQLNAASGYSDFNIFCAASGNGNCEWSGGTSVTVSLPQIDRTAPTVSLTASAASTSSISLSVTSSVNAYGWAYSLDGGSYVTFDSQVGTTKTYTITGVSSGSHTVRVRATKYSNDVYGYSSTVTVDTSPPTITASVSGIGSSGFTISASSNVTCNIWDYSLDNGSTWTRISTTEGTSTSVTVTGLSPNTTYNVKVRARKKSNNIYGASSAVSVTTLGGSILHSVANVTMDDTSPAASFVATVYGSFYHSFRIYDEDGTTLLRTLTFDSLATGTNRTYSFSYPSATRSSLLSHFPNTKTCVFKVVLETYADSARTTLVGASGPQSFTASTTAANSSPTFTSFTYEDIESAVTAITQDNQILLQTYSHLRVTATAGTALNGSSITGYSVSIGDVSMSGTSTILDVGAVNSSGSLTLRVTCSDSRGYSTSVDQTVTVLAYSKPRFTQFTLRRRNEIDSLVQLSLYGMISSVKPGNTELNSIVQVKFKYKQTSDSTYTEVDITSAITISGLTFSYVNAELLVLDETNSFDFYFYVYDAFGNLTVLEYYYLLNQGTPLLAFRKRSQTNNRPRVGVNNPSPYYELDVHGDIAMHDVLVLGFVAELTTEYLNNLKSGGYYTQSDANEAVTTRNYPVTKAGLLEILANGNGPVIQRYFPFDMAAAYARCYDGSSWTGWKTISMS